MENYIQISKEEYEELKKTKELFGFVLDATQEGIWDYNVKTNETFYSDKWYTMLGYKPKELPQKENSFLKLLHPEDLEKFKKSMKHYENSKKEFSIDCRVKSKSGKWLWICSKGKTVKRDKNGNPERIVGTHTLIQEKKEYEEFLKMLAKALENTSDMIVVTDKKGYIIYINPAFSKILGFFQEEILASKIFHYIDGKLMLNVVRSLKRIGTWKGQVSMKKKSGEICETMTTVSVIKNKKNEIENYVVILRDETKERNLEKQLLVSQKMEAIGTLAGGIAHDFNNILYIISGYSEILQLKLKKDSKEYNLIGEILKASERGSKLVNHILTFSKQKSKNSETVFIKEIIEEVVKLLKGSFKEKIDIKMFIEETIPQINGDSTQIYQVIMNLLLNAVQSMSKKTKKIEITLKETKITKESIDFYNDSIDIGDYVEVKIKDYGEGIEPENINKIFDPYFTTKNIADSKIGGKGLGLSIVLGVVKNHKGYIAVESLKNKGTVFQVLLPVFPKENKKKKELKVLLLFNRLNTDKTVLTYLDEEGFISNQFSDFKKAFEYFCENNNNIDFVICEQKLFQTTGINFVKKIRTIKQNIPAILCCDFSDEKTILEYFSTLKNVKVIFKPVIKQELLIAVKKLAY